MNVGAQPGVVGEVPANMVGVVINHDVVAVPIPVITVGKVKRGDTEVEAAKPETAGTASLHPPTVSPAEATFEMAMLPGVVEVEAVVVVPALMPDPFAIVVDVRSFRVALIVTIGSLWRRFVRLAMSGRWTMVRSISATDGVAPVTFMVVVLRKSRE